MTSRRKVRTTSSHHGPYAWGYTRATMAGNRETQCREVEQISKPGPSSDRSLQFDSLKLESLVIADQHAAVNTFSSLVLTARHIKEAGNG